MNSEFPSTTPPENDPDLSDLGRDLLGSQSPPAGSRPKSGWQPPSAGELQAVLPQYEVTTMLGRGGMGAVYMGRQLSLDRPVAIKILSGALEESDMGFSERFKNEARAMAKLSHPGIIAVFDFGETAAGLLYIVMEYIEGTDVAKMIAGQGRLHTEHAMAITAHVCDALAYAHDRGIIHRDIKPANIMVGYDGVVKVADFGLAKVHGGEGQSLGLTMSGMAMGTVHFMAPEALEYGVTVDHRADIYAVGVMLFQMLTGKVPHGMFELPSMQVSGLDPRYDRIIAKAMREDRELRYQAAIELRYDLDAILTEPVVKVEADDTQPAAALPTMARPQRPGRRGRRGGQVKAGPKVSNWALVWIVLAVLVVGGVGFWLNSQRDSGSRVRENVVETPLDHALASAVRTVPTPITVSPAPAAVAPLPASQTMEGTKAGEVRVFGGIEMVWCPPGEFLMGSPEGEEGREDDETQHRVRLTQGFWMAKTETTQALWQGVMGDNPSSIKGDNLPVETVSWDDVQGYLTKMNSQQSLPSGWKWVLPSEAQWEYACRAGTTTMYAGDLDDMAWYNGNSGNKTNPVGTKKANAWGLHDMQGNVWEWCGDLYGHYESGTAIDSRGATFGSFRVLRGGGWLNYARNCRAAIRGRYTAVNRSNGLGFRAATVPADSAPASTSAATSTPIMATPPPLAVVASIPARAEMEGSRAGELREFGDIEMVWCPAGEFLMGSPEDEEGREDDETQHRVRLTQGFWMAKTETTQAQWRGVMGDNPSSIKGDNLPVETVSWGDVQGYLTKMNSQPSVPSGWKWVLPTEAQWEYACRAGTETAHAGEFGEMAWYAENSGGKRNPVGTKKANAWGLHDMHGNVWEWCADYYKDYASGSATDPKGATSGGGRVNRGASWASVAQRCRSARRSSNTPDDRFNSLGFRPALVPSNQ